MMHRHPRQPAFVLLLTLVLLAMAGVILLEISRTSMREALQARQAEENLQQRWAARSCQRFLLHRAQAILLSSQSMTTGPQPIATTSLPLGHFNFELHFTDEQAKVNLNRVLLQQSPAAVARTVQDLLTDQPLHAQAVSAVQIRPVMRTASLTQSSPGRNDSISSPKDFGAYSGFARLGAWGQVFSDAIACDPQRLAPDATGQTNPLANFTLWGNGKVNFHHASQAVLQITCRSVLDSGKIAQIIDLRRQYPGISLSQLMDEMECNAEQKAVLPNLLTNASAVHGMWMIIRRDDGQIRFARFIVDDRMAFPVPRTLTFAW